MQAGAGIAKSISFLPRHALQLYCRANGDDFCLLLRRCLQKADSAVKVDIIIPSDGSLAN
jgi:hypothetical protein